MHFWSPDIDPSHPMDCTQPERYVLRRISRSAYIAIDRADQSLIDVDTAEEAYGFHTHEAALRAAGELNRLGSDMVDVVKVD
jgi:hypothetical protein